MSRDITSISANHKVIEHYIEILNSGASERLAEVLDPEYVQVIPQSGEVLRGIDNFAQVMRNYPGIDRARVDMLATKVTSPGEHDLITSGIGPFATYNLVRMEGEGDTLTAYSLVRYPDGDEWFLVSIATLRNRKIVKEIWFFGPMFEPPAWRSAWATTMNQKERRDLLGFTGD